MLSLFQFYFDIFRTKFSAGTKKKRLPNQTTVITDGKYKNLTMFTWIFSNINLIKYILSTKIVSFSSGLNVLFYLCCELNTILKSLRSRLNLKWCDRFNGPQ